MAIKSESALGLAGLHRGAYHHRVEQTSKVIYGSLGLYALCVVTHYEYPEQDKLPIVATIVIVAVAIVAFWEIYASAAANTLNLDFAHKCEDAVAKQDCESIHTPKGSPRGPAWIWQLIVIIAGASLAIALVWSEATTTTTGTG